MTSFDMLPRECWGSIMSWLRYKDLVRVSLTCREAYQLYWELQGRVRSLRAKNVERRRKRQALFAQLQASRGLEVLSLTNVQHPSSNLLFRQIASMGQLCELSLPRCQIAGPLPEWLFERLPNLRVLDLSNNALTGPLPASIGRCCRQLEVIKLSFNSFEGEIPASWASLPALRTLSLSYNPRLSGPVPAFCSPTLVALLLGGCSFSGPLPELLGECHALQKLLLNDNFISGKLPETLGKLNDLEELVLSSNKIEGVIPDELELCGRLRTLDLQGNRLETDAPRSLHVLHVMRAREVNVFM